MKSRPSSSRCIRLVKYFALLQGLIFCFGTVQAFVPGYLSFLRYFSMVPNTKGPRVARRKESLDSSSFESNIEASFDAVVRSRQACKKFRRQDANYTRPDKGPPPPTESNPIVVQKALQCLELAQRSPTSFNTQPYKVVLVQSAQAKQALSKYALGPNRNRVLDSDCTAVFCADRQVMSTFKRLLQFTRENSKRENVTRKSQALLLLYISMFSSGYPLPRILAAPLSFLVRLGVSILNFFTMRCIYTFPSFSTAETWATKQTSLVAMTYLLACTSRGLATCPMEGINAGGIRRALNIPRRYAIPLIVATGLPYSSQKSNANSSTLATPKFSTPRFPAAEMIFCDQFGSTGEALSQAMMPAM